MVVGSGYYSFGVDKRRGWKETIHSLHGSLYFQKGDTPQPSKVQENKMHNKK